MLSVVCPVYNEAENIGRLLDELKAKVTVPLVLVAVYDRDDDTTLPVLREAAGRYPFEIRAAKNRFGRGALNAIKTGLLDARGDAVLVVMADVSDDLAPVDEMYRLIAQEGYDIVCGSRYMKGGRQIGGPRLKRLLSRMAGVSLHYLAGMPTHDVTNSFKMYRCEAIRRLEIESTGGFEIGMELAVKTFCAGGRITELPTTWTDRVAGESRFRLWKWLPHYLHWYFYAIRRRWLVGLARRLKSRR